jgi:hypothetical protein
MAPTSTEPTASVSDANGPSDMGLNDVSATYGVDKQLLTNLVQLIGMLQIPEMCDWIERYPTWKDPDDRIVQMEKIRHWPKSEYCTSRLWCFYG